MLLFIPPPSLVKKAYKLPSTPVLGKPKVSLGGFLNALGVVLTIADLAETFLAPAWFGWLENQWGSKIPINPPIKLNLPPGTHRLKVSGSLRGRLRKTWLPDEPQHWYSYFGTVQETTIEITTQQSVTWTGTKLYDGTDLPPLPPHLGKLPRPVYGGPNALRLLIGNQYYLVPFSPNFDQSLGPFYDWVIGTLEFSPRFLIQSSTSQELVGLELQPEPAKRILRELKKTSLATIPQLLPPEKFKFPKRLPKLPPLRFLPEPTKVAPPGKETLPKKWTDVVPLNFPLTLPPVSPELEPIREILDRILKKECPPPCPPPEKDKGKNGGQDWPPPIVKLYWVDRDCNLQFYSLAAEVPNEVLEGIERTARNYAKLCPTPPLIAPTEDWEAPWKEPVGPHLKVVWSAIDRSQAQGYYSFRVPHWAKSQRETLELDWGSLVLDKGQRNCLEVRFSSRKTLAIWGQNLDQLEAIFEFLLPNLETGISFQIKKIQGNQSTQRVTLKVKKLEFWTTRAGHPDWWSWWPPTV